MADSLRGSDFLTSDEIAVMKAAKMVIQGGFKFQPKKKVFVGSANGIHYHSGNVLVKSPFPITKCGEYAYFSHYKKIDEVREGMQKKYYKEVELRALYDDELKHPFHKRALVRVTLFPAKKAVHKEGSVWASIKFSNFSKSQLQSDQTVTRFSVSETYPNPRFRRQVFTTQGTSFGAQIGESSSSLPSSPTEQQSVYGFYYDIVNAPRTD